MKFQPGQSGNPAGRPVGTRNFTTKVREALEKIAEGKDYTYEEAFVKSILKKAIIDQDPAIMRLIWNYLDGMPAQDITTGGEKLPTPIINVLTNVGDNQDKETREENQSSSGGDISE